MSDTVVSAFEAMGTVNPAFAAAALPVGLFLLVLILGQDSGPGLSKDFPLQFRVMAQLRTPILMFIVVPLSYAKWLYTSVREHLRRARAGPPSYAGHDERVAKVVADIKLWNAEGRKNRMRTARPNWASMSTKLSSNKGTANKINTAHLNHILDVDEEAMTITCEPMVTMGMITEYLLPKDLALVVQVEMESITIGGISMGFGMETNSHRTGLFQETVVAYEICTPDADILKVTEESDPELFRALPWSHGSLGFLMSVTVRMQRIKPFVRITYVPTYSTKDLASKMETLATQENSPSFLEATIYTRDKAVIQCAEFCDAPATAEEKRRYNGINWWWKPFYYKWVETFIEKGESWEIVPTKHFYHRFTRSIFWEIEDMIPFSNHPIYRLFWGWMGAPEVSLLKLFQGPVIRKASVYAHVVQESIMPIRHLGEGVERFDDWYGVYPLLVFPIRVYDRGDLSGFLKPEKKNLLPGKNYGIWVDLGAYGAPRRVKQGKNWDAKYNIREMEHWTREKGGWQATYTDVFATRKEFRAMFNHELYDKQRRRLGCLDAFPEVYDKIKPESGIVDLAEEEARDARS
mmetsp:Transcript_3665/g.10525  ORF Transcript_3665/g.10525 Transcript_3665/m.10525 type:complete len:577 (-) Transcript_3665:395-2125(-)|eukprot:CAMPEP_0118863936 /NCGR_PEP_ID=MMETSP1163-20130328/8640_1 /TAXON_ID=124430 /ORGANISM="Phaeomonas parva, Strain CCMP2877" /LENGTH=576 /DNA_ID=CAMNT_0006797993 /DNA_START=117 /DNA_END=1847 /DNA_ORIENTATION=-